MITRHILCVYMNVCASDEKWVFEYEAFIIWQIARLYKWNTLGKSWYHISLLKIMNKLCASLIHFYVSKLWEKVIKTSSVTVSDCTCIRSVFIHSEVFCNQFDMCMDTGQHPHTWQSPVRTKHRCNCPATHPPVYPGLSSWGSIVSRMFTSWACLPGAYNNSQWLRESWPCVIEGGLGWSVKLWQSYLQVLSPEHNMKQKLGSVFPLS